MLPIKFFDAQGKVAKTALDGTRERATRAATYTRRCCEGESRAHAPRGRTEQHTSTLPTEPGHRCPGRRRPRAPGRRRPVVSKLYGNVAIKFF